MKTLNGIQTIKNLHVESLSVDTELFINTPLTTLSSSVGTTFTPAQVMNGIIDRTLTSTGSAITDTLPSATEFKTAYPSISGGEGFSCIFRVNNTSGQSYNLVSGSGSTMASFFNSANSGQKNYVDCRILFVNSNANYHLYKMGHTSQF